MDRLIKHVNLWVVILIAVLVGQSLVLAIVVDRLDALWTQVNEPEPGREMTFETSQMIHNAVSGIYTRPSVDAPTNRLYFPDLRIYLPYNEQSKQVVYDYMPAYNKVPGEVTLNSNTTVNIVPLSFSDISCMQGMVDVSINKAQGNPQATVKLADGRTIYMKTHPAKEDVAHCSDVWGDLGPSQMMDLFKQAKSY